MRYNNTLARLRHVFDVAKDAGIIYANPRNTWSGAPVRAKKLTLPNADQLLQLVDAGEHAGASC